MVGGVPVLRDAIFRRSLAIADLVAALGAVLILNAAANDRVRALSLVTIPLIVLIAKLGGRYDHEDVVLRNSTLDEMPALLVLAGVYALAWSVATVIAGLRTTTDDVLVLWMLVSGLLILTRSCSRSIARQWAPLERVLLVGDSARPAQSLVKTLACDPAARFDVVGFVPLTDAIDSEEVPNIPGGQSLSLDDLSWLVSELDVDRVLISPGADSEALLDAVSRATGAGVKVSIVPRVLEVVGSAVEVEMVGGVTLLGVRRAGLSRSSKLVKRGVDLVGSGIGMLLLTPLAALIALAIKLDSPGPIFFRQRRVGRDGLEFQIIKFRSMVDDAEAQRADCELLNESEGLFKIADDPRMTRVGRWLRRMSLDELPQLINVFRGEMSLVGPRPLIIDEDRLVEGRQRDRLQLPPGMTGPWQVLGPSRPPLTEMAKADYLYAATWSLWSDVKILLRTIAHVTARRGM